MTILIIVGSLIAFFAISFFTHKYANVKTRILYHVVAVWSGFLFCVFLVWLLSLIIPVDFIRDNVYGLAFILALFSVYQARHIKVQYKDVLIRDLPESWQGVRAVFISDIHLGQINGKSFAQKISDLIVKENPDIIFITGDVYDGVMVNPTDIIEPFAALKPPLGAYFVRGNHEEYGNSSEYLHAIKNIGITILDNKRVDVKGVSIIGVDYRDTDTRPEYMKVLESIDVDTCMPTILLKHVPTDIDLAEERGVDLQLSGLPIKGRCFPLTSSLTLYTKDMMLVSSLSKPCRYLPPQGLAHGDLHIVSGHTRRSF